MTELTITRCGDCPFVRISMNRLWVTCGRSNLRVVSNTPTPDAPPTWCPLRSGPTVVRLSEKGES